MAKKVKKARTGQKDKRGPLKSPKPVTELGTISSQTPDQGSAGVTDRGLCSHIDKGINVDKLAAKLRDSGSLKCEDCREHIVDGRGKKGKGKHGKKGANSKSETKAIWICLECGHFACGGLGLPTTPQSHAIRHSKQNHHPLVVHYENHQQIWCFLCNKLIPAEKSDDSKQKETLKEVAKILKRQPEEGSNVDVEDVWFGSGSVSSAIKMDYSRSIVPDAKVGHSVRGLVNLGNTCFFNSIMQNLLAIHSLREYLVRLDESVGPLIGALRKFFLESSSEAVSKGAINPRSLFGTLCTKAPQFRGYQQHDSHELLRCLLDGLSTEELSARKLTGPSQASVTSPTFVDVIFGGELSSTVSCLECGHSSTIYEPFLDLSLPVPTKKLPPRRIQPVTRGKKPKLPPRRSGSTLSKFNREADNLSGASVSAQSIHNNSFGHLQSIPQPAEQAVPYSGDHALSNSTDPNATALDMGFGVDDLSAVQKSGTQQVVENAGEQPIFSDSFVWLDYLDPVLVSGEIDVAIDTEAYEISASQGSANKNVQNDISSSVTMDSKDESNSASAFSVGSIDSAEDSLSPSALKQDQDSSFSSEDKQIEKPQTSEGHSTQEVVQNNADIDPSSETCGEVSLTKDSNFLDRENKNPPQIEDLGVILLPYKEEASPSVEISKAEVEFSPSVPGDEQDSSDFVGIGDLFNEPEDASSSDQPSTAAVKKELSSESDPDEVDNANAPVSVESCLALFTKAEILSKDEHAWQCDNCSKILREGRIRSKSKLKLLNGCEDVKSGNRDPENDDVGPCEEISENGKGVLGKHPDTGVNESDSQLENMEARKFDSFDGPPEFLSSSNQSVNPGHGEIGSAINGSAENDLLSAECELELTEQEVANLEKLKVKRDATKSILIRKAPPVLTIQLKRFGQDARGRVSKLNGHVVFKETINLKPYMDPRCSEGETLKYRLVGLVEHLGSMRGGHYVAYMRSNEESGDCVWYHASDAYVRQVSVDEVLRCQAYILFYERT
ncbi:ubiquitin carboxyl-terminal hydrolase [Striga asiatica]|uniref:ubiquitinyl hydrolase 1 n=1 Tax=Striga asiatica TaxID=4170 RepID=A0A5A7R526_STRAF|nr:ubiquitin carboxyl-terminal hydrolase [Striga asiatica]